MIRTELIRRLAEVLREPFYEAQIVSDRPSGIVTTFEFFEHHLAKAGHSGLPPVSHTLNRPQNYSSANNAATAAPAASCSPPIRKFSALGNPSSRSWRSPVAQIQHRNRVPSVPQCNAVPSGPL